MDDARDRALGRGGRGAAPAAARRGDADRLARLWSAGAARVSAGARGTPDLRRAAHRRRPVRFPEGKFLRRDERTLSAIPKWLWALLAVTLAGQLAWQGPRRSVDSRNVELPPAPSVQSLRLASFGEREALARILSVHIQSFELKRDYARLVDWLRSALELDPRSQYPLFLAARVYA